MKKTHTTKIILLLLLAMMLAFTGCAGDTPNAGSDTQGQQEQPNQAGDGTFPMTVTDAQGSVMTIEAVPERIVSISPSCTEILYALGLGDKVVGVSTWCTYPEDAAAKEKIGDTLSINIERIIELEADIMFVSGTTGADAASSLVTAGIPVFSTDTENLEDIYNNIIQMGIITGAKAEAEALVADMKADVEAMQEEFAAYETKRVFIDLGGLYSSSKHDYLGTSLALLNAENIALDYDYSSPQLSAETVLEKDPEAYVVLSPESDYVQPAGFETMTAFKNDAVYFIPYEAPISDMISRDGPRFVEGLKRLGTLIHTGEMIE